MKLTSGLTFLALLYGAIAAPVVGELQILRCPTCETFGSKYLRHLVALSSDDVARHGTTKPIEKPTLEEFATAMNAKVGDYENKAASDYEFSTVGQAAKDLGLNEEDIVSKLGSTADHRKQLVPSGG
jgi:hypothetical protein